MKEEPNEDLLKKLVEAEPQVIKTTPTDISVSVPDGKGGKKELIYTEEISSSAVASTTAANLGIELESAIQEKFIEGVEEVRGYRVKQIDVELGLPKIPLAKATIKFGEQKTIKRYTERKEKQKRNFNQK